VKPRGQEVLAPKVINVEDFISIKGYKALGNQVTDKKIKAVTLSESLPYEDTKIELENIEVNDPKPLNNSEAPPQTKLDL
jgi:topoisomerase-4 subunit A